MIKDYKWITLDTPDGERTLRQHCFRPDVSKSKFTGDLFVGNVSLCGNIHVGNESEEVEIFVILDGESQSVNACLICSQVFKNQYSSGKELTNEK